MAQGPAWLKNAVFYQIYPQSFKDSNGDGIGDFKGIIGKLDYIRSLGVNGIWMNPCFDSPFNDAGYDVADYYKAAPRYGTNKDLERLFGEAHKRGIKVCLDLVPGHTAINHAGFEESCRERKNAWSDRFIWTNSIWDKGGGSGLQFINGYAKRNGNYATNFFWCQPAINYGFARPDPKFGWQQPVTAPGPQANRQELRKIIEFWLKKGADGFRVDMAFSLVKKDKGLKETMRLWQEIRAWMDKKYPEAVLISEWGDPAKATKAGFHVDFFLPWMGQHGLAKLLILDNGDGKLQDCFFDRRGKGSVIPFIKEFQEQARGSKRGYISVISANHDFARLNQGRSVQDLKTVLTMLLTWPGVPFIYYGDEIGMQYLKGLPNVEGGYHRCGSRTPMQWDDKKNAGFSSAVPEKLYLPVDSRRSRPTVAAQDRSASSLLNHVRRLNALRSGHPALQSDGKLEIVYAEEKAYPFIYTRSKGRQKFLVVVNPCGRAVAVQIKSPGVCAAVDGLVDGVMITGDTKKMTVKADGVSYGVFRIG